MSSYSSAELQANNIIVRDFSSLGNEQHPVAPHEHTNPEQSPSKEGGEEEEEGRENRSGFSTTNTTAETLSITTTDHHAKLPYTRFYSPKWTFQHQPPQDSMPPPPPPIPSFHPSASQPLPPPILPTRASFSMSRADVHRESHESDSSYGSRYSTMPYEQHYRDKGSSTVPSRRTSTRRRVSSGYLSDGSTYSTDVGGRVDTVWRRYRVRDEERKEV